MMNLLFAWLWQGLLVAAVATIAVRLVPAAAAARRHAIWWLALLLIVTLPIIPSLIAVAMPIDASDSTTDLSAEPITTGTFVVSAPPAWVATGLITLWSTAVLLGLTRVLLSLRALRLLTSNARAMDPVHEARLTRWMAVRDSSRPARLRVSDQIRGACATGFLEPTLLVSSDLVATLSDEALDAIVLHEFAHLERYDDWTGLLQRLFVACSGLHVAVWWISRQIDFEREVACDQRVVVRTGAPVLYARSLAAAATVVARGHGQAPSLAPGASTGMLHARVTRLLTRGVANRHVVRVTATAATLGLCVTAVVLGQTPALVAFITLPPFDAVRLSAVHLPIAVVGLHPGAEGVRQAIAREAPIARALPRSADTIQTSSPSADVVAGAAAEIEAEEAVALPSTPLAVPSVLPSNTPVVTVSHAPTLSALGQPFVNLGAAVGAAGATTGQSAARAGASIGRWFKNRSADVVRPF